MRNWIGALARQSFSAISTLAKWFLGFAPLVRFFGLLSFSAVLGACIYVWGWGLSWKLVAETSTIISPGGHPPGEIWFSPSGSLFVSEEREGGVYLTKWIETRKGWRSSRFDIGRRVATSSYAISSDGEFLAWICKGRLCASRVNSSVPPQIRDVSLKQKIVSLEFVGRDLLVFVLQDSSVRFYNLRSAKRLRAGFRVLMPGASVRIPASRQIPWTVKSQDSSIVVSALPYRFVACAEIFENGAKFHSEKRILPAQGVLSVSVYGCDLMAAGTSDGMVVIMLPGGENKGIRIPSMLPVRSLAFYDKETILAMGDFPGVYAVAGATSDRIIESGPGGAFAFQRGRLAYFDSGLMLAQLKREPELNRFGTIVSLVVSIFVSFVALIFSLAQEQSKRR